MKKLITILTILISVQCVGQTKIAPKRGSDFGYAYILEKDSGLSIMLTKEPTVTATYPIKVFGSGHLLKKGEYIRVDRKITVAKKIYRGEKAINITSVKIKYWTKKQ